MTRVLVVDDEPQILRALRINLRVRHYEVHVAPTGAEAFKVAAQYPPDLVILDLGLPDLDGVEVRLSGRQPRRVAGGERARSPWPGPGLAGRTRWW